LVKRAHPLAVVHEKHEIDKVVQVCTKSVGTVLVHPGLQEVTTESTQQSILSVSQKLATARHARQIAIES